MANRVHIVDRKSAAKVIAATRAPSVQLALNTLIIAVSLALLTGAVWTHVT